ncbi:MAG: class I SAM-dependent methyltransferase [Chlamydiia bacterium]
MTSFCMRQQTFILLMFAAASVSADFESWTSFRQESIEKSASISGWCTRDKAALIMDLIHDHSCKVCVEIGVFLGASLFPISRALQYQGCGKVYAIDAWDPVEAVSGYAPSDPNYVWWMALDFDALVNQTKSLLDQYKLRPYCKLIRKPARQVVHLFADESIDFIHLDGNHMEIGFEDVLLYFPKVRDGGYVLLNDPNWFSRRQSLVYLLERAEVLSAYDRPAKYLLLQKTSERLEAAHHLTKE